MYICTCVCVCGLMVVCGEEVWMNGWMYTSLAFERLDRMYSHLVFKSLPIRNKFSVNLSILSPKTDAHKVGDNKHKGKFLKSVSNEFDYISIIYGEHIPK
jgi:hypothetical protein